VYLFNDITFPIATYSLSDYCNSGIISDSCLYLGGDYYLKIFELTKSLADPLKSVTDIKTKGSVKKILRIGYKLLLAEFSGWLEVFDMNTSDITSTY
jgi:hypothetical protein